MAFPRPAAAGLTGAQLSVVLTPPTLPSGSASQLNCGWHTGCNSPSSGIALDFDDENQYFGNPWYFRGFFYASDSLRTAFRMYPMTYSTSRCYIMTVWIVEIHSGALMATPLYSHMNVTNNAMFTWQGGPWTVYNSRQVGVTYDDTNVPGCSTGSHVHEYDLDYRPGVTAITRNTPLYPTSFQCSTAPCSNQGYGPYPNNNINNWTRRFAWSEGVIAH